MPAALLTILLLLAAGCGSGPTRQSHDGDPDAGGGKDAGEDSGPLPDASVDASPDAGEDGGGPPPECESTFECDDLNSCTTDACELGRCVRDPVAAATDQGLCDECDGEGGHRPPADDAACAVVDCGDDTYAISLLDPTECVQVDREDIDDARCVGVGECKTETSCEPTNTVVETLAACERFEPGTCSGTTAPAVEDAPAGQRTAGCDTASCDGNDAVEAGCDGNGACVTEYSRVACGGLTCVADEEGARCE